MNKTSYYVVVECDGETGKPIAGLWGRAIFTNRLDKAEGIKEARNTTDGFANGNGHKWVVVMATREY
jgi:hypothetical protein